MKREKERKKREMNNIDIEDSHWLRTHLRENIYLKGCTIILNKENGNINFPSTNYTLSPCGVNFEI